MLIVSFLASLSGCSGIDHLRYADMQPKADLRNYFTGPLRAWGIIQDRSKNVVSRFDVKMVGRWDGDQGVLEEDFSYYDGSKQKRVWKIRRFSDENYEGTADDIIGKAKGSVRGNAMHWVYEMDVPVEGSTYRIKFDDWMWLLNDGVIINRSYLKKFGFTVAEITIVMMKENA